MQKLDLNGEVCPMPAALTRKALKKMNPGDEIEITGDFEPALENVIGMAEKNNGTIISSESGQNYFKVIVKKK